jgi:hypothetical protein
MRLNIANLYPLLQLRSASDRGIRVLKPPWQSRGADQQSGGFEKLQARETFIGFNNTPPSVHIA